MLMLFDGLIRCENSPNRVVCKHIRSFSLKWSGAKLERFFTIRMKVLSLCFVNKILSETTFISWIVNRLEMKIIGITQTYVREQSVLCIFIMKGDPIDDNFLLPIPFAMQLDRTKTFTMNLPLTKIQLFVPLIYIY